MCNKVVEFNYGRSATQRYYRERALTYDKIYALPERQCDLNWLRSWVRRHVRKATVLDVAAGTGYWTHVAAKSANQILSTDFNIETLNVAAQRGSYSNVLFSSADAFMLPVRPGEFDVLMAHFWWSHVANERRYEFLKGAISCLKPNAKLLLIDGRRSPRSRDGSTFRRDHHGNRYELRIGREGEIYEIIKNYTSTGALVKFLSPYCNRIRVTGLENFWALSARVKRTSPIPE